MIVILSCRFIPLPRAAPKSAQPIIRRSTARSRVSPNIPTPFRMVGRGSTLPEPGMLIRGVIGDKVKDQANAACTQSLDQSVEILKRAIEGINPAKIGDVVTEIKHRRRV